MAGRIDAGQCTRESIDRILITDEQDFARGSNLGSKLVPGAEACLRERVDGDRHLVLAADPGPAPTPLDLYLIAHG